MHYLITGGAGLIGSHLAELLLDRGNHVSIIDDLSTGSIRNIAALKERAGFSYIIDSVLNERLMAELVDEADGVFHLAAAVGVKLIVESPVHTIETNVSGTEVVLSLAAKKKKPVLVASSSEVYGKSSKVPFKETGDLLLGPTLKARWAYACSKAIDEFLALAYYKEKKLPTIVARLFNTVGPRQTGRYGMVIPTFVGQALAEKPITVFGDGAQSRCFCHVADTAEALAGLIESRQAYGNVYNVGSKEEVTITQLAERVRELTETDSPIVYVPYDEAYEAGFEDMPRRVPDITRINDLLGWQPQRELNTILKDVIAHKSGSDG
jgi:UDP-glucose 4-epimerase